MGFARLAPFSILMRGKDEKSTCKPPFFKGGTTVSKIFGVIRLFSEHIDLAVDWEMLGSVDEKGPLADLSTTKRDALLDEILEACRGYICTDFVETLWERVAEARCDLNRQQFWHMPNSGGPSFSGLGSLETG